jgi:[ribosomal protein S18]-alanine N-acetyltransferase
LEVRSSNSAALHFYERHNFQTVGRRSRYYNSPIEDALLLSAKLR